MRNKSIIIIISILLVIGIVAGTVGFLNKKTPENTVSEKEIGRENEKKDLVDDSSFNNSIDVCLKYNDNLLLYEYSQVNYKSNCKNQLVEIKTSEENAYVYKTANIFDDPNIDVNYYGRGNYIGYSDKTIKVYNINTKKSIDTNIDTNKYDYYDVVSDNNLVIGLILINKESKDYKDKKENIYSYYSLNTKKIYDSYAYIDSLKNNDNTEYIYLGELVSNSNGNVVNVNALTLENERLVEIGKSLYHDDSCKSSNGNTYFFVGDENVKYGDYCNNSTNEKLYDKSLHLIMDSIGDYSMVDNYILTFYGDDKNMKDNSINIYDSNGKLVKDTKKYQNLLSVIKDNYIIYDTTVKLLPYENILNDTEELIDTGIKLGKNEVFHSVDFSIENNKTNLDVVEIRFLDYSKTEDEVIKLCGSTNYTYSNIYTYNLKTKKTTKDNFCLPNM